jgi:hypothetical protein
MIEIPAALATIKIGKEAVKLMIDAPKQLEKTEMQLKLASINKSLFDAENALLESQKLLKEKDLEISDLKDLQKFQEKLVRKQGLYIVADEDGNAVDGAYCPICWETEKKAIHLIFKYGGKRISCFSCKNEFGTETGRTLHAF